MSELEEKLENEFQKLGINKENQESIKKYLGVMKLKDQATYEHSIRVGLLSAQIAKHLHLDEKALFYSGTLHDIGKITINSEILKKTDKFTEEDMNRMKDHSKNSYLLLKDVHEFSAEIALRHHLFQEKGYPETLPENTDNFSKNTHLWIDLYARILSLADFYDAITTRNNDKFGGRKLNTQEIKSIIIEKNKDAKKIIENLYTADIFK